MSEPATFDPQAILQVLEESKVRYVLIGGLAARRVGLPTIVGYLLAGVALGPFTTGFHADEASIHQ